MKKIILLIILVISSYAVLAEDTYYSLDRLLVLHNLITTPGKVPKEPYMTYSDLFISNEYRSMYKFPAVKETYCGDNYVSGIEKCEFPNSIDSSWCPQNSEACYGNVLQIRDPYGNCNSDCYCAYDTYVPTCSKQKCNSACETDTDCPSGHMCNISCECVSKGLCGDGIVNAGEECDSTGFYRIQSPYCIYLMFCQDCQNHTLVQPYLALGYEICDGTDNDCDGKVDESEDLVNTSCGPYGVCSLCSKGCINGQEQECLSMQMNCTGLYEHDEMLCDGRDNDCDGYVDEGLADCCLDGEQQLCGYNNEGVCSFGMKYCNEGTWTLCNAQFPQEEDETSLQYLCDAKDNDCDGKVDENCVRDIPTELCNYYDDNFNAEPGSPTSAVFVDGHYEQFDDYCPEGERCNYCDLHDPCICPDGRICGPMFADGIDNNGDAYTLGEDGDSNPLTFAIADGIDNDGDGYIDEGIDEGIDEYLKISSDHTSWCQTVGLTTLNIPLNQGWNLISIPLEEIAEITTECINIHYSEIPCLLSSIEGNYTFFGTFDNEAKSYIVTEQGTYGSLTVFEPDRGYWIKVTQDTNLVVSGIPYFSSQIRLNKGWNLVGPITTTEKNIADALGPIMDNVSVVRGFDETGAKTFDPLLPALSDLQIVKPYFGYWINVKNDTYLSVS
ncbi:MAG: MopE-related protein [Nanoarchaeota archaeon]